MDYLAVLLVVMSIHVPTLLTPGADVALVSGYGLLKSRRHALGAALGVTVGSAIMVALSLVFMNAIHQIGGTTFFVIKLVGALYLLYLAVMMIWSAHKKPKNSSQRHVSKKRLSMPVVVGIMTEITNPKTILFFVTVFLVVSKTNSTLPLLIFAGALIVLFTGLYYVALALLSSEKHISKWSHAHAKLISYVAGVVFVVAAVRLLWM